MLKKLSNTKIKIINKTHITIKIIFSLIVDFPPPALTGKSPLVIKCLYIGALSLNFLSSIFHSPQTNISQQLKVNKNYLKKDMDININKSEFNIL